MGNYRPVTGSRSFSVAILLAGLLAFVLAFASILFVRQITGGDTAEIATTAPTRVDYALSSAATLNGSLSPIDLIYRGTSGTVTGVEMAVGKAIVDNDPVFTVDGVSVVAWKTDVTYFRELSLESRGQDVRSLEQDLLARGYFTQTPDDYYGTATRDAVREFQRTLHISHPDGSFRPGYVIRLPQEPFVPDLVTITQDTMISAGQQVGTWANNVNSLQLASTTPLPPGEYRLLMNGESFGVSQPDSLNWTFADSSLVDVKKLVAAAGGQAQGQLRELLPTAGLSIPPSSIIVDGDTQCVLALEDADFVPIPVSLLGSEYSGAAVVRGDEFLTTSHQVAMHPIDTGHENTCS